jgi:putative drug exporter of the RND superfamily
MVTPRNRFRVGFVRIWLSSDVINIGQAGSTICIGLIFDMIVVRLFLVLPLARLLGRWFSGGRRESRAAPDQNWPTRLRGSKTGLPTELSARGGAPSGYWSVPESRQL